ncbi:MAG: hypothetical protein R2823_02690 [Acidimicrobiia bacterium]
MLRESAIAFTYACDIAGIADRDIDTGVPGSGAILDFVDAVYSGDGLPAARAALTDTLGPEAMVDAAAVYANFEMMNRVAEGSGIHVPRAALEREASIVATLRLDELIKP